MRWPAILIALLISNEVCNSQIESDKLLKTWMPISKVIGKRDTVDFINIPPFLVFSSSDEGEIVHPGWSHSSHFDYHLNGNILTITLDSIDTKLEIQSLDDNMLSINLDSSTRATYIPLPKFPLNRNISDLSQVLADQVWTFEYADGYNSLVQFESHLTDSTMVNPNFWNKLKTAYHGPHFSNTHRLHWSVDNHDSTMFIRLETPLSSIFNIGLVLVKDFNRNQLELVSCQLGECSQIKATRINPPSKKEESNYRQNLTRHKWRFKKEKIPPPIDTTGLLDLGDIEVEFEEWEDPLYVKDSTLLLNQRDLDDKLLILEFHESGTYRIYRESRVLDEGTWKLFFHGKFINLISDRENGDGLYGGYLEMEQVSRRSLKIRRFFDIQLDYNLAEDYSNLETYKPVKRK